ncbi:hypothetical protein EBR43_02845 [bacterium]|nr:hypothetical protein [bacterium]
MELTQEQKNWLDKCTQGTWSLNKSGLVDIDGSFNCKEQNLEDFKGVKFGVVGGDFYCYDNKLTSLEGAPQKVKGSFDCRYNKLTSLEGAPQKVGGEFDCSYNKLTSLEGAPQEVGWSFYCRYNELTSLVGAPQVVGRYFYCSHNKLTSLVGAPQVVKGSFLCSHNQLTSLEGAPQEVGGDFDCSYNLIRGTTLKLIHKTMVERDVPYIIALGILKTSIDKKEFDKLSEGLSNDTLKGASMMGRFLCP